MLLLRSLTSKERARNAISFFLPLPFSLLLQRNLSAYLSGISTSHENYSEECNIFRPKHIKIVYFLLLIFSSFLLLSLFYNVRKCFSLTVSLSYFCFVFSFYCNSMQMYFLFKTCPQRIHSGTLMNHLVIYLLMDVTIYLFIDLSIYLSICLFLPCIALYINSSDTRAFIVFYFPFFFFCL